MPHIFIMFTTTVVYELCTRAFNTLRIIRHTRLLLKTLHCCTCNSVCKQPKWLKSNLQKTPIMCIILTNELNE